MIEFLANYGLFLLKTITLLGAIMVVLAMIFANMQKRTVQHGYIEVTDLNEEYDDLEECFVDAVLDKEECKARDKAKKAKDKTEKKEKKKQNKSKKKAKQNEDPCHKPRIYVVSFEGDMEASAAEALREEITAILSFADKKDEVLAVVESEGGLVHSYGFAASQLKRIRDSKLKLTVAVDKVAASGGYMMACVAEKIIAAPFAVLGSIGVIAQLPNFNKVLTKHDIDYEMHTAGEYKRTLTVLGENTEAARHKFIEELEDTHSLFKSFVNEHRPKLDLKKVATGEHWYGSQALKLGLVDEICTSDDYLLKRRDEAAMYQVKYIEKQKFADKISEALHHSWAQCRRLLRAKIVAARS